MTTGNQTTLGYLGYGTGSFRPFNQVFDHGKRVEPAGVKDCSALVIWGGEDISTSFYNEDGGMWTDADRRVTRRDQVEADACKEAIANGIPIIGVCRGAQLLCALAGGKLVQHVDNHARGNHDVTTVDGKTLSTSSLHHQMMWPYNGVKHELIAWSREPMARTYAFNNEKVAHVIQHPEPEILWFPEIKGLAIQGHPEFMADDDEFVQYCMELVRKYIV